MLTLPGCQATRSLKVHAKSSTIEELTKKVVSDVGEVTGKVKENPSLLLRSPKKEDKKDGEGRKDGKSENEKGM